MECNDETECINETGSGYEKGGRHMTTISSDVIRGYNDTIILYLLLDRPSYGYEISRMIRTISGEKYVIKETTLYSAFTRMEKNGYITSFSQNAENGKRRTYYSITDAGREYYREKCAEWNLTKEVIEHFISPTGVRALPDRQ
jgi:PadR family transcriptional regulator PadR